MSKKEQEQDEIVSNLPNDVSVSFVKRFVSLINGQAYKSISKATGLSDKSIRDYARGVTTPNIEKVQILADYLKCNPAWLAFGVGSKIPPRKQPVAWTANEPSDPYVVSEIDPLKDISEEIVYISNVIIKKRLMHFERISQLATTDPDVSSENTAEKHIINRADIFEVPFFVSFIEEKFKLSHTKLSVYRLESQSMSPLINPGDYILLDHSDIDPKEGLYLVYLNETISVQQIQQLVNGKFIMRGKNPNFAPQEIARKKYPKDFSILGKVLWIGKKV